MSAETLNLIGKNATVLVEAAVKAGEKEVTLTGANAVQCYLVVLHVVLHRFSRIHYDNGRNEIALIAQH